MDDVTILRTLQQAVTAAVAASTLPALPVSYVDVDFAVPANQKWLEIVWIPNNRQGDYWGDEKNYQGMMRLVLHWPKNGGGAYSPLDLLSSIAAYFNNGRLLQNVQIYASADFQGIISGEGDVLYPISMRYQSFRS